ncbi:ATP-binding protein [Pseudomonadota bacterium]
MAQTLPTKSSEYRVFNARLSHRITQVAVSVTLSLAFVIGISAYLLTHSLLQENITHALDRQANLTSQRLELNLGAISREISGIASTTVVSNALLDSSGRNVYLLPLLSAFKLPYDIDFKLVVTDFEGKPVASNHEKHSDGYKGKSWVNDVIEQEIAYAELSSSGDEQKLTLAYPVLFPATGQAEGMLALEFPLNQMLNKEPAFLHGDMAISLTSKTGHVAGISSGPAGEALVSVEQELNLPSPLDALGLQVAIGKNRTAVYAPLQQLTMAFALVAALIVVVVIFVARFMAQRITAPLAALSANAQNIALSGKPVSQVSIDGADEVAALAHSFNNMVARLQCAHEELEQRVEERTRELLEAQQAAEQANSAKSEFLANMSHEFRTPMHAILSFTSLAIDKLETAPSEKTQHYLERIHESGSRLLSFLNDLLDLSKLEAGKMEYCMGEHEVRGMAEFVKQELDAMANNEGVQLSIQATEDPTLAWCDRERIIQVLSNLLTNAIKFTPYGKSITVSFSVAQLESNHGTDKRPALQVTVRDQGIGIPEDELPSIFDKFVQSSKTKTGAGGTGLGLAICKEIIGGHGGRIWAETNPDEGATFSFIIPCHPESN